MANPYENWHINFGHIGKTMMRKAELVNIIKKIEISLVREHKFISCLEFGKRHDPIPTTATSFSDNLELTQTDISGKIGNTPYGRYESFTFFLDHNLAISAAYFFTKKF